MKNVLHILAKTHNERKSIKDAKLRAEFLPEALEILETPVAPMGRCIIVTIFLLVVFIIVWITFGKIDEVALARGKISSVSGVQLIQAPQNGTITKIAAKEGDLVKVGVEIAVIDTTVKTLASDYMNSNLSLLKLKSLLFDDMLRNQNISNNQKGSKYENDIIMYMSALQNAYYAKRDEASIKIEQNKSQVIIEDQLLQSLKKEEALIEENLKLHNSNKGIVSELEQALKYMQEQLTDKEKEYADCKQLFEAGAISKLNLKETETLLLNLKNEIGLTQIKLGNETVNLSSRAYELKSQREIYKNNVKRQEEVKKIAEQTLRLSQDELDVLEKDFKANISNMNIENNKLISEQDSSLKIQQHEIQSQTLVSPVDGIVKTVDIKTVGGVVTAAQTVATVIPEKEQLIVEVDILNKDIGFISIGQKVSVKIDTYNFQLYGKLDGALVSISPDAIFDERNGWVYKAKIAILENDLLKQSKDLIPNVGMECTAEIEIGKRTIIEFFIEPLVKHFDSSLKVR